MLAISNFCPPESNGSSITQHVRELVKDCIEHAKITNEIQDEKVSHYDDTSLENKTLFADATSQQQKEEKIAQVGMSYLYMKLSKYPAVISLNRQSLFGHALKI